MLPAWERYATPFECAMEKSVFTPEYSLLLTQLVERPIVGINDLQDGQLRMCLGQAGAARPTFFEATPANGQAIETWTHVKD